jgi:hypothetical protein
MGQADVETTEISSRRLAEKTLRERFGPAAERLLTLVREANEHATVSISNLSCSGDGFCKYI